MYEGVSVTSLGAALPQSISNNVFESVDRGATLSGANFVEVSFNQFLEIPEGPTYTEPAYGVLLESAALSSILSNRFETSVGNLSATAYKRALVIKNSTYDIEDDPTTTPFPPNTSSGLDFYVEGNTFNGDFLAATQFEQDNTDLGFTINCNHYEDNTALDWYLHSDCDMAEVGECDPDDITLAYRGSWHNTPNNSSFPFHIWDASTTLTNFNFRNNSPQIGNTVVTPFSCGAPAPCEQSMNPCGGFRPPPISPTHPIEPQDDRRYFIQQVQHKLVNHDYTGAIQDLKQRQEIWADKILVATYIQLANFPQATQTLNRIPTNTLDNLAFVEIMSAIVQNQILSNESLIRSYANDLSLNSRTNILAQSILGGYFNENFDRNASLIASFSAKQSLEELIENQVQLSILPNPTNSVLNITWSGQEKLTDLRLHIYNNSGFLVKTILLNSLNKEQVVNLQDFEAGMYFCYLQSMENIHTFEKLIIIK